MSAWRRKAIEYFPHFRRDFNRANMPHPFSVYHVFFDLLRMMRIANQQDDQETLRKIYDYAERCLRSDNDDISNAAGVAFYEHVFDHREDWERVIPWLSPYVVWMCRGLWEARPTIVDVQELQQVIAVHGKAPLEKGDL